MKVYLLIIILTFSVISCNNHSKYWETLTQVESFMEGRPDSVLSVLQSIEVDDLLGKEEKAKHALLLSMALDKNYIDTTAFDVLQPAIDYYMTNGSADDKLRVLYYQGRIYQNQGNEDSAMRSFIKACDLRGNISDSLLLAHTLVAQATLYHKQYKIDEFIHNNIEAAKLYRVVGKPIFEIKSYTNAIDGFIIQNNKSASDSIINLCIPLVQQNRDGETYLFSSLLSHTIEFGTPTDIRNFLNEYSDMELTGNDIMNFAQGYSKIGEYDKAVKLLSQIKLNGTILDSLKYISVKTTILDEHGKYKQALDMYKDFSIMLERYQSNLLSQELLFADKRHQLEMKNIIDVQNRDKIIWSILCGVCVLLLFSGWLYYRVHFNKTKRIIAEKDKMQLEAELRQQELEAANLLLEKSQLENERDNLKELLKEQSELSKPIQEAIKIRLEILNSLLAKEITHNENYAKPYHKWIETVRNDKKEFMNSTRLAFTASHPKFIEYLKRHRLSIDEINYLCLYAIGLRGKEVGEYIQLKRHYNISSEIRKKLGIDEHETNIGPYIRGVMKNFEE